MLLLENQFTKDHPGPPGFLTTRAMGSGLRRRRPGGGWATRRTAGRPGERRRLLRVRADVWDTHITLTILINGIKSINGITTLRLPWAVGGYEWRCHQQVFHGWIGDVCTVTRPLPVRQFMIAP